MATVTFNPNNGDERITVLVKIGENIKEPQKPVREKYNFLGWYDGNIEWDFKNDVVKTSYLELSGKWEIKKCTISFDANGHGSAPDPLIMEVGNLLSKSTLWDKYRLSEDGYLFLGWYEDPACKKEFQDTHIAQDMTLYAKWVEDIEGQLRTIAGVESIILKTGDYNYIAVATMNVGATSVTGENSLGAYYRYIDVESDDVDFGGEGWRLPTNTEIENMQNRYEVDAYNPFSSYDFQNKGWRITIQRTGNSLFIPSGGYVDIYGKQQNVGIEGHYLCYYSRIWGFNNSGDYGKLIAPEVISSTKSDYHFNIRAVHDVPSPLD